MNALLVFNFLGWLVLGVGALQVVPMLAALAFGEPALPYAASGVAAAVCGLAAAFGTRPEDRRMRSREGFLMVGLAWLAASLFGSLPYYLAGELGGVDGFFESVSGFTTTGSTVMLHIDDAPRALLLWRAMTQWLGGMGIIVFAVALMPLLGVGGMQLFKAETPGPIASKITPRIAETARRLWLVYVGITSAEWVLLMAAGLSPYEALCHAFTTVSTGGFSTHAASIGGFHSPLVEWIVIVFMTLGGINFVIHYRVLTGRAAEVLRDGELRYFLGLVALATTLVAAALAGTPAWNEGGVRTSLFQVVAVVTTTGFATADFETWPALCLLVLLQLMVMGGMAGSTAGGVKSLRILIGLRALRAVFTRLGHPHAVTRPVRYGGETVPDTVIAAIWAFFTAYFLVAAAAAGVVAAYGYDVVTSVSASLTAIGNVGPGLGAVGPFDDFAHLPAVAKLVLVGAMLAGRLELFTVLILFHRGFWRR